MDLKFELEYFWNNRIMYPIRVVKNGFKNYWYYRKVIWNDRWWDYGFLHVLLRHKLNQMAKGWENAHYCGSEYDKEYLHELVELLDNIDILEDDIDKDDEINEKYQEFGRKLFDVGYVHRYNEKGNIETTYKTSKIRTLWD
jgi:hypothetical protein